MANKRFNQITRVVTSFDANDVLPIGNGTLGDGKMTGDKLLELTAQNALSKIDSLYDATFEQGGLASATGEESTNSARVRTVGYDVLTHIQECYAPSNWSIAAYAYTSQDVSGYLGRVDLISFTQADRAIGTNLILSTYPTAKYVRFMVTKDPETIITPEDVVSAGVYVSAGYSVKDIGAAAYSAKLTADDVANTISITKPFYDAVLEQGTLASATGADTANSARVRTRWYEDLSRIKECYSPSGWSVSAYAYTSQDVSSYLGNVTVMSYTDTTRKVVPSIILTTFPTAKYVRFVIRNTAGTNITPSDVVTAGIYIKFGVDVHGVGQVANPLQYLHLTDLTLTADSVYRITPDGEMYKNGILTIDSMFTQGVGVTAVPYIEFTRDALNYQLKPFASYIQRCYIGKAGTYTRQQYRVPPFTNTSRTLNVSIVVPAGVTLKIRSLSFNYDNSIDRSPCGFTLCAHGPVGCAAPVNTLAAFEAAAKLGYRYCITIPKVTSDGVFVCLHDDTSIQATARNDDGTAIAAEYKDRPVSDFTYAELLQFDFGIYAGIDYAGERIPKLEDFFALCARTGMHPMLSVHPTLSGHWPAIKALAKKYGVLSTLGIKSGRADLEVPMATMLDDVESYTIDSAGTDAVSTFDTYKQTYGITKARCIIEYQYSAITDALIASALAGGYECGVYSHGYNVDLKSLAAKGVTVSSEDYNCSVGLNW